MEEASEPLTGSVAQRPAMTGTDFLVCVQKLIERRIDRLPVTLDERRQIERSVKIDIRAIIDEAARQIEASIEKARSSINGL